MRKLLIADCSEDYRTALANALTGQYHVLCCRTGTEALELLRREKPDIFVLDLMLPELDGLTLLERTYSSGIRPVVLAVTPIITSYMYSCAQRLGIEYIVRKPCEIEAIASRARDLTQRLDIPSPKVDPESYVTELLLSLTFSTKHNGFSYLRESILLMSKDPAQSVTKVLYPAVASTFGCQKENVERSIRTAMDYAWERGDHDLWCRYFPDTGQRPTNAVFISRITEALLLEE
jgi:two-component system response regulator (stage 0 sporulation protein A)